MHKGPVYPWHRDLWAVPSLFWDPLRSGGGWIPRKMWIAWDGGQPIGWTDFNGFAAASLEGVVAADRQSVEYRWPISLGIYDEISLLLIATGVPLDPRPLRYSLAIIDGGLTLGAAVSDFKQPPVYTVGNAVWPTGIQPPAGGLYTPPDVIVRPAKWAEV